MYNIKNLTKKITKSKKSNKGESYIKDLEKILETVKKPSSEKSIEEHLKKLEKITNECKKDCPTDKATDEIKNDIKMIKTELKKMANKREQNPDKQEQVQTKKENISFEKEQVPKKYSQDYSQINSQINSKIPTNSSVPILLSEIKPMSFKDISQQPKIMEIKEIKGPQKIDIKMLKGNTVVVKEVRKPLESLVVDGKNMNDEGPLEDIKEEIKKIEKEVEEVKKLGKGIRGLPTKSFKDSSVKESSDKELNIKKNCCKKSKTDDDWIIEEENFDTNDIFNKIKNLPNLFETDKTTLDKLFSKENIKLIDNNNKEVYKNNNDGITIKIKDVTDKDSSSSSSDPKSILKKKVSFSY